MHMEDLSNITSQMARVEYFTTKTALDRVDSLTVETNQTRVSSKLQRLQEFSKPIGKISINIMRKYEPYLSFIPPFTFFPSSDF